VLPLRVGGGGGGARQVARAEEGRDTPRLDLAAHRLHFERFGVGGRSLTKLAGLLLKLAERGRHTWLVVDDGGQGVDGRRHVVAGGVGLREREACLHGSRVEADHAVERVDGLLRLIGAEVEPAECEMQHQVAAGRALGGAFEMGNGVLQIRRDLRRRTLRGPGIGVAGKDQTEGAMGLGIGIIQVERGARRLFGVVGLTAPEVKRRNLPAQLGRLGRRLHGAIEGRLRTRKVAGGLEPPRHQERKVRVRVALGERTRRHAEHGPGHEQQRDQARPEHPTWILAQML